MRTNTPPRLTPTERVVMQHYINGLSRECIAAKMVLSYYTITTHLRNAKQKLGARNMAQAGARYVEVLRSDSDEISAKPSPLAPPRTRPPEKDT